MVIYPKDNHILERIGRELEHLKFDGTFFVNYALYDETKPRPHGAWFTHLEPSWKKKFDEVAKKVDFATCQNKTIQKYLMPTVAHLIYPGHDERIKKKPVFGWNGRFYKSGRKGEELIKQIGDVKLGNYENAPEFYKEIDYLIITSRIEGGPMCVVDAISAGVPIIAREGLGWCDEFPAIRYKTDQELLNIVNQLRNPPTWEEFRKKHQLVFSLQN